LDDRRDIREAVTNARGWWFAWASGIVLAVFLAYSPSLRNGFVWDDHILVEGNPETAATRPVFRLSLMADKRLWGMEPGGYHLTNLLLHSADALLVARLGTVLLGGGVPGLLAGLLFAVHPVNTEAVNAVSFRADPLALLFVLLALLAYIRFREAEGSARRIALLLGTAAFYLLGLLSKEMAVTFPALALLYEWTGKKTAAGRAWRAGALCLLFSLPAVLYLGLRAPRTRYTAIASGPKGSGGPSGVYEPSAPQWDAVYRDPRVNFMTMSAIFADYFRLMLVPHPLSADRAPELRTSARSPRLWYSWALLAGLAALVVLLRKRHPSASFGLGWCFIALAPVSNIIPIYNPVAERYLYMVSAGACWVLAWLVNRVPARAWQAGLSCALILPYACLTFSRSKEWRSDETLFGVEVQGTPGNARVLYNQGLQHQLNGRNTRAMEAYKRALALHPGYVEAMSNLGYLYEADGRTAEAVELYRSAVELEPASPIPYDLLGSLLDKQGKLEPAMALYRRALKADDGFYPAYMHLAVALDKAGRMNEALLEFKKAARADPTQAVPHLNMGVLLQREGRHREAEKHLKRAASLDPGNGEAALRLGIACREQGKSTAALQWLYRARRLAPLSAEVYYRRGQVYSDLDHRKEAVGNLEAALGLQPAMADALRALVDLELRSGRTEEAQGLLARAVRAGPMHPGLRKSMGDLYRMKGEMGLAIFTYKAAIKESEGSGDPDKLIPKLHLAMGICRYELGEYGEAAELFNEALRRDPRLAEARRYLAMTRKMQGLGRGGP
jgi:tetratricopeptide (TPR) repeat protein